MPVVALAGLLSAATADDRPVATAASPAPRFRVAADQAGVYWFVAPDGSRMLSKGVDCTGPGVERDAYSPGRPEYSFATRPGDTYDAWQARTLRRFRDWGFNTAGGWNEKRFERAGLPFTPVLHIGVSHGAPWVDPWEPGWAGQITRLAAQLVSPYANDPNVLGYFLDNEFGWGDDWILDLALGWPGTGPGKQRVVQLARTVYRDDFRKFRGDFDTTAKTWDGLLTASATGRKAGRGHQLQDSVVEAVTAKYYELCGGAVRKVDPGALVLGDRFRQYYPQAVARAARGRLDVISTNWESPTTDGWISPAYFISMHEHSRLPVIIGEVYATARENRSGNRNHQGAFTLTDTQPQRAAAAAAQVAQYARMPFVVGWHWFQYMDEPTHGRDDGEDYNMGLVDIYDEPYGEITQAFRRVHEAADRLHAGGGEWLRRMTEAPRGAWGVVRRDGQTADGLLGDWVKSRPVPRGVITTEAPQRPFGDVFLAWDDAGLRLALRVYDFSIPAGHAPDPKSATSWGDLHRLTVKVDDFTMRAATGLVAAPKAPEDQWKTVRWVVPPKRGQPMPAVWSHVDRWHYVWEVIIPASVIAPGGMRAGRAFALSLDIENRGDFERMRIDRLPIELLDHEPAASVDAADDWYARQLPPPPARPVDPAIMVDPGPGRDDRNDDIAWPPRPRPGPGPGISAPPGTPPAPASPVSADPAADPADDGPRIRAPRKPRDRRARPPRPAPDPSSTVSESPREHGRAPDDRHRPEKPPTPEEHAPVPETKDVPGHPPAANPGQADRAR